MTLDEYLSEPGRRAKAFAIVLGVKPVQVSQWRTGARQVPADACPSIERATGGKVTCEELRPDVEWAVIRGTIGNPGSIAFEGRDSQSDRRQSEGRRDTDPVSGALVIHGIDRPEAA